MFSTVAKVRAEAGFEGNASVTDDLIEKYLIQGHGIVQSYVSAIYNINDLAGANFVGSQAEGMLSSAEDLISAGLLLIKEYGLEGIGTEADGYKKKAEGENLLKQLLNPKAPLRLLGLDGVEFTRKSISVAGGISASGAESGANKFSVNDVF